MPHRIAAAFAILLATTGPAAAANGVSIPEPTDPWLFGLGVIGLLVGRQVAKRRPPAD
jgi:hypothetical protein